MTTGEIVRERAMELARSGSDREQAVAHLREVLGPALDPERGDTVTLVDERLVPEDHPDSNAALVRQHLLTGAASAARFLPLAIVPANAAASLAAARTAYRQPDVTVLGMGDDGHTVDRLLAAAYRLS